VAGLEVALAPGELVQVGGWTREVAGYDLRSLLVGSEGTLGIVTAVRLRLLPAPERAIATVVFTDSLAQGCAAILEVLAAGLRPSVLDFLDELTLKMLAGSYPCPAGVPAGADFALIVEVEGSEAEARAQAQALRELLQAGAVAIQEPARPAELWRWREGINGVVTGVRGRKLSEDVVFPLERLQEGLERFAELARGHGLIPCAWGHGGDGNVHATVLVDPAQEQELDAAEALMEELFELVAELGGAASGEHGAGWVKRGALERQWAPRALDLHEQIKRVFDPKGLLNPGKKLARYPARSPVTSI
jgi:FAD/FMN-containing dehydrogenase